MRIADIAIFMFIFQALLGVLNTVSFLSAGQVSSVDVSNTLEHINESIKEYSLNITCGSWDLGCQVQLAAKQFYLTWLKPASDLLWAFGKAVFIGEFLRDLFKPIDPGGELNGFYYVLDAISGMVFIYGFAQFIRGVGFRVVR